MPPAPPPDSDAPLQVLFVCTANICRSPYLELRARALADGAPVVFSSAGTNGLRGQPMDPAMARELDARGVPTGPFTSRPVTVSVVDGADLVLTAEARHRTILIEENPAAFRRIFTLGQLAAAVEQMPSDVRGRALVETAGRRRGHADESLDVEDPYRRGPAAIAAAAVRLDALLDAVVPRLG